MKNNQLFKVYKKRMTLSAIVSSICLGLAAGGLTAFILALVAFLFSIDMLWVTIGVAIGVAVVVAVLLYLFKFRPTDREIMRRIDRMGLEERAVTMYEYMDETSVIAKLQREDAVKRIESVDNEKIKKSFPAFNLKKGTAIVLSAVLVLGLGMTVVSGLSQAGLLPSPDIDGSNKKLFVSVSYQVEEGGEILGETDQLIDPGADTTPVVAVAEDGWVFVRWSDGNRMPDRSDVGVNEDLVVTAIFEELDTGEDDPDIDEGASDSEGDYDPNIPESNESEGAGNQGEGGDGGEGNGDGSSGEGSGSGQGGQEGQGNGNGQGDGAGGSWSSNNWVIDGETDYRDVFEMYYDMAMEIINSGEELPPELKAFIEGYFGSL